MQHSHCQIDCMLERPDTGLSSSHVGGQQLPLTTGRFGAIPPRALHHMLVSARAAPAGPERRRGQPRSSLCAPSLRAIARCAAELVVRRHQDPQHAHELGPFLLGQRLEHALLGPKHRGDDRLQERAAGVSQRQQAHAAVVRGRAAHDQPPGLEPIDDAADRRCVEPDRAGQRALRRQYVGDEARVSGHVVYRAVIDRQDFPADLQWNAAAVWVGPNCHLVHYPLRGGEQYNVVVTFHSREKEEWSVREGSREEVQSYFEGICAKARQLIDLPKDWKRWATADREPIGQWNYGRATLLGDAAHPTLQYLAQGACMAMEDAVTLGEALRVNDNDFRLGYALYQRSRVARTARIVLSAREMGRIFHAKGVERLVRNELWKAARRSASMTRWSGSTAGRSRTA